MAGSDKRRLLAGSQGVAAVVSAIISMHSTASAQTAATSADSSSAEGGLQEIIVTATRRTERLQDVPEAISAIDTNQIAVLGVKQMEDYARLIPGLTVTPREPGATTVVFRGVAASGLDYGAVSSAALYLDEQAITLSGRNPDPRLIDIERVEALRGPQGTLYGSSSQSGTLRIITNKPNPHQFDAWADAQISDTSHGSVGHELSAMVNLPLASDTLALRLVGFTADDAGFIDNVLANSPGAALDPTTAYTNADVAGKDVNKKTTSGGRAALRWDASSNVDATLGVVFQNLKADGHGDVTPGAGDLNQVRFSKESLNDQWYQAALTVNARLPFGDLVTTASYFDRNFRYEADATDYEFAFSSNAAYASYDFGLNPRGHATNHEKTKITTFEARLSSPGDSKSRWGWLGGVYYSSEKSHTDFASYVNNYSATNSFAYFSYIAVYELGHPLAPTDKWFSGRYDTELKQYAVFGELGFDATEHFRITVGGRWFDYDRQFTQAQEQPEGLPTLNDNEQTKQNGTVKKLNLTYRFDKDRLVYATYSEGFRVGGSNPLKPESALPKTYRPDKLYNYELGAKTDWWDHRLRLNVAVYDMKWKDFAVQIEDPTPLLFQLGFVNLPSARIKGLEVEAFVKPAEAWELSASFARNDARVDGASTLTVISKRDGQPYSFSVQDGARLPLTPSWNAALGVEYRPQLTLGSGKPWARFDYAYVGSSVNSLTGIESVVTGNPVSTQDPYRIGNLRVGIDGKHWSGSLFIDNIWDERANLFLSNRWTVQRESVNRPRTIGMQVHYDL